MKRKEIAKFFCGFETFHALLHGYFLFSGTTLTVLGITPTLPVHVVSVFLHAVIAVVLGIYAWKK